MLTQRFVHKMIQTTRAYILSKLPIPDLRIKLGKPVAETSQVFRR